MAIDVKSIIGDAFLHLCRQHSISKLTIRDIQEASGVSRQTFYNHFKDKYDLIRYVYDSRVISLWTTPQEMTMDYYLSTLSCFQQDVNYAFFMQQACRMGGINCLTDHMYEHSRQFDRKWHQAYYGSAPMPPELVFASDYHSAAAMRMRLQWIADGMPIPPEKLVENTLRMRLFSLNDLLFPQLGERSPYVQAATYIDGLYDQWRCRTNRGNGR